ncbi:hypothetical protein A8E07_38485 [Burkholderia cenocepacia]|uniref:hypothetical protein n=1 Tax=Burkholderia cenocepacia TaxID=95486 RepID=UPI000982300F|nr:hypothetical protein [Burkholderia cenocepacia]ONQ74867.1 hypothetical protein A8E07_38485 [Burkholderia cenocepacia]ONQ87713.1 hypothetical protein A8E08_28970 [Burkholderia cenocepacia]
MFVLTTDNWDDFGHQVQFHLSYVDAEGKETRLGAVKILQRTSADDEPIELAKTTHLPNSFPRETLINEPVVRITDEAGCNFQIDVGI